MAALGQIHDGRYRKKAPYLEKHAVPEGVFEGGADPHGVSGRSGGVSEGEGSADDEEGHGARAAALILPSLCGDAVGDAGWVLSGYRDPLSGDLEDVDGFQV